MISSSSIYIYMISLPHPPTPPARGVFPLIHVLISGFRYVLGAVETFLKAVPAAGMFRGE